MAHSAGALAPRSIKLPRSSSRLARGWAHCRVITALQVNTGLTGFEGPIYPCGAYVDVEIFGHSPVVIECVGPVGPAQRTRQRDVQWILWTYRWNEECWSEVARAQAPDASWANVLRPAAAAILQQTGTPYEIAARGAELADAALDLVRRQVAAEPPRVVVETLQALAVQLAGWLADLLAQSGTGCSSAR